MKIQIKLHPNSSQEKIQKHINSKSNYEVWLKEKPINNKANIALIKFLKKHFKTSKIKITSGNKGKKKIVKIE